MGWELIVIPGVLVLVIWLVWRGVTRHRAYTKYMDEIQADIEARILPDAPIEDLRHGAVLVLEDGFSLRIGGRPPVDVKWDDIVEITAYKADIFTYDIICLVFSLTRPGDPVEVDEQTHGYDKFEYAMEAHYGDALLDDWWRTVAFPAFVPNVTVIWPPQERVEPPAKNA